MSVFYSVLFDDREVKRSKTNVAVSIFLRECGLKPYQIKQLFNSFADDGLPPNGVIRVRIRTHQAEDD